ncbi:diguanylate cyclase domain-containing protein [Sandaracinus amylolyticus]|uniref:GGDEF domain-containing protein n=1 Tax=Sandaracinus amylolyticus TaxID=927083 RepID=A0A0F6W7N1_9BACT|nr:diguanylate cyclase [Sandaracinus amylolyticus]AKF09358.1 hypothetical protein DB32_006507 [Sandaracinus amylolyticus]
MRLRDGIGVVDLARGRVVMPGAREKVDAARSTVFHVVDAARPIAVLAPTSHRERAANVLLRELPVVAAIEREATGAAVASWWSRDPEDASEDAAGAIAVLKACGGWDESPVMVIAFTFGRWLTVDVAFDGEWRAQVREERTELEQLGGSEPIVFVDVDRMRDFNVAYGYEDGDLALARVHAAVGALARSRGRLARVGGDELAILPAPGVDAQATCEAVTRAVAGLAIPFIHPEVPSGHLEVTAVVVTRSSRDTLRTRCDAALLGARRRRRT